MHAEPDTQQRFAMLEREPELGVARRTLDAARGGAGRALMIEGAAGIGKSRLLEAIADSAATAGFDPLGARGNELERECSFGVVGQLLEARVRSAGADRERLFREAAGLARPLFEGDPEPHGWADDRRFQLLHGLHWLVAGLAEREPLLLAVDDAQWVDEPSLSFLSYLTTRLDDLPVALVMTRRDAESATDEHLLGELARRAAATVRLAPLGGAAAADLVRMGLPDADDALCEACSEATGGNPFYLTELVRALRAGEIARPAEPGGPPALPTPDLVARAVPRRIRELGASHWELAEAVAVLGEPTPLHRAARLAGIEPSEASAVGDSLCAAELLGTVDPASFAHPIVAAAVRAEIPAGRGDRLRLRAAALLEKENASPEQVAALLVNAARGESTWVTDSLRRAARRARSRGAPAAAVGYLRRALEEAVDRERHGTLLAELGLAEAEAGEERGSLSLGESVELLGDAAARGRALYDLAVVHAHGGRYPLLLEAAERGLAELDGDDPELRSELLALAAQGHAWTNLHDQDGALRRLREVFEPPGSEVCGAGRLALASAAVRSSFGGVSAGEVAELASRSVAGFEPLDHPFAAAIFPLAGLGLTLAGELERAEEVATAGVEGARRRGSILDLGAASHILSQVHYHAGNLTEAVADAEGAVEAGRRGWGATLPMAHAILALSQLERGRLDEAAIALELPGGEERWMANVSYGAHVLARGELWRARGESERALDQIRFAGKLAELAGLTNPVALPWRPSAATLLAGRGEDDEADALLDDEERFAREFGAPRGIGIALRARGELRGGAGGIACLREAVELLAASPARLEHARALIELGSALRRAGERGAARPPLREGTDLAHRCGASVLAERGMEELRMSGARPRRPATSGAEALTPGELRIAALAAERLSNREIAESLFLTRRTVEMHLSNAYRKLGIGSREELPGALGSRAA